MVADLTQLDMVRMRIADLTEALTSQNPGMLTYLKDIHSSLMKAPELVHMLSNAERSAVIRGLEIKTGESITTPKAASKALPKAKIGSSISDLI